MSSFEIAIQEAPRRLGTYLQPVPWTPTGGTVPTLSGIFVGTGVAGSWIGFYVNAGGTIGTTGTITVSWEYGGTSGPFEHTLNLGTSAGYTAGEVLYLVDGISVAFNGTVATGDYTLASVYARRRFLGTTPAIVRGTADPVDAQLVSYERGDIDAAEVSWDGREVLAPRANSGIVRLHLDHLDDVNMSRLRYLKDSRARVCVGENYGLRTQYLFRGAGVAPFVGQYPTFSRTTSATYDDPRTGVVRAAPINVPRIVAGRAGRAMLLEQSSTNLVPISGTTTPSSEWTAFGAGSTLAFDTTVIGPIDPYDTYWNAAHATGVAKLMLSSSMTPLSSGCDLDDITITASAKDYTGSIWVKGRGLVRVLLRGGVTVISTTLRQRDVQLTEDWQRIKLTGTSGATHNRLDLQFLGHEQGVCYFWGWQIEQQTQATAFIQTSGGATSRGGDVMPFTVPVPVSEGTLSFAMYWQGNDVPSGSATYTILDAAGVTGSERFRFEYTHSTPTATFLWYLSTSGTALSTTAASPMVNETWYHFALTWAEDPSNDGALVVALYREGALVATASNVTNWQPFFGTAFSMGLGAGSSKSIGGLRVEELRVDEYAMSATEVAALHGRLTQDAWLHVHRAHAGREYRISRIVDDWMHTALPDKAIADLELREVDRLEDAVVTEESQ